MNARRQRGWSTTEYLLMAAFVVTTLLVKVHDNKTAPQLLVEAVKEQFANYSYAVSLSRLPVPRL